LGSKHAVSELNDSYKIGRRRTDFKSLATEGNTSANRGNPRQLVFLLMHILPVFQDLDIFGYNRINRFSEYGYQMLGCASI